MNRLANKLICLIISASLVPPPFSAFTFAEDAEAGNVVAASDLEEYIDATDPADDPDPVFGTRRLKVRAVLECFDGAAAGVSYDGNTLLSFETVEETERAYERLCEEYGEENVIVDLPFFTAESTPMGWGVDFMNIDDELKRHAPGSAAGGKKVTVAIIDSGIDSSHEIFSGNTISAESRSFIDSQGIADEEGHGTSVAGIVAEATPDNTELLVLKTYTDGSNISIETVNQAVRYAADCGADVINLSMASSLSGSLEAYPELVKNSIDDMEAQLQYAREKGSIIVTSSGNSGGNMDELMPYPASSGNTLAVGSVNNKGEWSDFSNYGSVLDFCAPGEELVVAAYNSESSYYVPALQPNKCSGTSFAAPYIAACCAYVKMNDADAGNDEAAEALKSKCIDYGTAGWDRYYGWGMPRFEDYKEEPAAPDDTAAKEAEARAAAERAMAEAEAHARATTSVTVNAATVTPAAINAAIAAAGGRSEYVTELVIGKGVKRLSRRAFSGTNIKTLVVQSKKLKKKSVKGSLKGSAVSAIRVRIGNKKINKKYIKKYKKFFTKKNAGKKEKVH